jgi:hypothetical protein
VIFFWRVEIPAVFILGYWFLIQFIAASTQQMDIQSAARGGTAWWAHVGGFVAGLGLIGLHKLFSPKKKAETKRGPVRVAVRKAVPVPARAAAALPTEAPTLYVYQGETQYGPYNLFQIQQMMGDGSVTGDAQYWSEGMTEWRSITELTDGVVS